MKYSLLFGAGVDAPFGFPQGAEFALESIFIKDENLFSAIKDFFRINKQYRLFNRRDSILFRNCIFLTVKYIQKNDPNTYKKYNLSRYIQKADNDIANEVEDISETSKNNIEALYDKIQEIKNVKDFLKNNPKDASTIICQNLLYKGNVEKDFYCLIDKDKYGEKGYYKLFYYFWSAYFSILKPIVIKTQFLKEKSKANNIYSEILKKLDDITRFIYSNEMLQYYHKDNDNKNYYSAFKMIDNDIESILTTNYTPFAKLYYQNKCCYLSGDLKSFEISEENEIFELTNDYRERLFFPFIMTQAPIKPIVYGSQIKEYGSAINHLEHSDYLIIVGYSLCDNDNHILSIIKEFLKQDDKKIIYCSYDTSNDGNISERMRNKKEELKGILHFYDDNKIIVLPNDGNALALVNTIKSII